VNAQPWLLTRKHPPSVGGMQQLSFQLASGLRALRPVKVLAWRRGQWGLPLFFLWAFVRLLPALVSKRISVLHLGDPALSALAVLPRLFGVPVVVTVHGLDISWPFAPYQRYLRLFFWGHMQAYVAISTHVRDALLAGGIREQELHLIGPGVDASTAPVADPELEARFAGRFPVLLAVGRLVERKGMGWFLQSVAPEWLARHPDAMVVIAGDGPLRPTLAAAIEAHGLQSQVLLLGPVPETRKSWLFERCDLALMPNLEVAGDAEGFGLVALEAGRAGCWVAAADIQGLRDAVTEACNGNRLPPGNATVWAHALDRLCSDRESLERLGERARDFVASRFSWAAMAASYDRLFLALEADGP
jgi:phosphatidyl-myo-inositol dimannoside synthase